MIKNGNIRVFKDNKIIYEKIFEKDDNMYECLYELYNYLNDGEYKDIYKKQLLDFSEELDLYMKQ